LIGLGGKSSREFTNETPVIVEAVRLLLAVDVVLDNLHSPCNGRYGNTQKETDDVTNMYHKLNYQSIVQFDLAKAVVKSFAKISVFHFTRGHVRNGKKKFSR